MILVLAAFNISGTINQKMVSHTLLGHTYVQIDNPFIIDIILLITLNTRGLMNVVKTSILVS
jgi:hypothetical protein